MRTENINCLVVMITIGATLLLDICSCYPRRAAASTISSISSSSSSSSSSITSSTISNGQHKSTQPREYDSCHLRLDYTTSSYNADGSHDDSVYAGNGFNYAINCHVNDAKMRAGDKYYVIDLIVYGPNQRVAKAWREQFTSANFVANSKSFFLNKNLSFYWLGENNIVCAVNKYNSLQNKFTRICQNNITVDVNEKQHQQASQMKAIRPDLDDQEETSNNNDKNNDINDFFNSFHHRSSASKFFTTMRTTSPVSPQQVSPVANLTTTTTIQAIIIDPSSSSSNVSARAMELAHELVSNTSSSSSLQLQPPFNPLQPIFIGLIFFAIFLISIGTIIYLSYTAHSGSDERQPIEDEERSPSSRRGEYTAVKVMINETDGESNRTTSKAVQSSSSCDDSLTASSDNVVVVYNDRMVVNKI